MRQARSLRQITLLTFVALWIFGCTSRDIVETLENPSGDMIAVMIEENGGATTPFIYILYLMPIDEWDGTKASLKRGFRMFVSPRMAVRNLKWISDRDLVVEYATNRPNFSEGSHYDSPSIFDHKNWLQWKSGEGTYDYDEAYVHLVPIDL